MDGVFNVVGEAEFYVFCYADDDDDDNDGGGDNNDDEFHILKTHWFRKCAPKMSG